jgi:CMP-N-acetylneuraminic acid synthetase
MKHIAVIPARMGSVGFKHKNRILFDETADFLDNMPWFDRVIVTTDDPEIKAKSLRRGYTVHDRSEHLSGGDISIKQVFENLVLEMEIRPATVLWLFYLPIIYKMASDFNSARDIIECGTATSLCTFIRAKTHPFDSWAFDESTSTLSKYVPNDVFRRQDKPDAWEHYHYVCCIRADEIPQLNSELLNSSTFPIFLDDATERNLIEIDTADDFDRWNLIKGVLEP